MIFITNNSFMLVIFILGLNFSSASSLVFSFTFKTDFSSISSFIFDNITAFAFGAITARITPIVIDSNTLILWNSSHNQRFHKF